MPAAEFNNAARMDATEWEPVWVGGTSRISAPLLQRLDEDGQSLGRKRCDNELRSGCRQARDIARTGAPGQGVSLTTHTLLIGMPVPACMRVS